MLQRRMVRGDRDFAQMFSGSFIETYMAHDHTVEIVGKAPAHKIGRNLFPS